VAIATRIEALVVGRAHTAARPLATRELIEPLAKFAPGDVTASAWRDELAAAVEAVRARGVLDPGNRLRDRDELARLIGRTGARAWSQLANSVLPGLGLGLAADDKALAKLGDQDAWAAAIVARALELWTGGPPPSLAAVCDALVWRRLELPAKPKRCPPELRAHFVGRELGAAPAAPPERLVRLLAAREVGAPRPDLRALRESLVRGWLVGRSVGRRPFAAHVRTAASAAKDVFGDRKVFIASVWNELRRDPSWAALTLDDFKARLVAAHRAGDLALARADLVAAMDPELVNASETTTDGASFHFIVREAS